MTPLTLTDELRRRIPPLDSQRTVDDPLVIAKFFTPDAGWTWFVIEGSAVDPGGFAEDKPLTEFDPDEHDVRFFGYVVGQCSELGYFTLSQLLEVRGQLDLPIELDQHFEPRPLSAVHEEGSSL